jgi:deoxyribonuclease V
VNAWPQTPEELIQVQLRLGAQTPVLWRPSGVVRVGACFVCFPKGFEGPGAAGDRAWAAAVSTVAGHVVAQAVVEGEAAAPYRPGLLALREGPLLEAAVLALVPASLDVLLVDATGRDHPRRTGLALHLGAQLGVPSIGVTDRPLVADGVWPPDEQGASSPLQIGEEIVGYWVRTATGTRPLVVHAGWRTDAQTAVDIVLAVTAKERTPSPLRLARRAAREARARVAG